MYNKKSECTNNIGSSLVPYAIWRKTLDLYLRASCLQQIYEQGVDNGIEGVEINNLIIPSYTKMIQMVKINKILLEITPENV